MIRHTLWLLALTAAAAQAQTTTVVADPWVRGTVAQQQATGFFARVTSPGGGRLVAASSPLAAHVEVHEMAMDGDVMRMRALPQGLELPPGKTVELKPGGVHVMLMGLKQPLAAGSTVPVTLEVVGAGGRRETVQVDAPVRALGGK